MDDSTRDAVVNAGARGYYEWATGCEGEASRWDEPSVGGDFNHQEFAKIRARVILDAALAELEAQGLRLVPFEGGTDAR